MITFQNQYTIHVPLEDMNKIVHNSGLNAESKKIVLRRATSNPVYFVRVDEVEAYQVEDDMALPEADLTQYCQHCRDEYTQLIIRNLVMKEISPEAITRLGHMVSINTIL